MAEEAVAAFLFLNSDSKEAAEMVSRNISEVVQSSQFDRDALLGNYLKLSEAYCLLWHDSYTGDVDGRQGSKKKLGGAVFAVLVDLLVLGKIQIDIVEKKFLGIKYKNINIVVKDTTPTGTYLDRALFNQILDKHKRGRVLEVEDWVRDCVSAFNPPDDNVASVTLDNLVQRHIVDKEKDFLGLRTKYPTVDPEPKRKLVSEIRKIALENCRPEAYMRVLLTILRATDNLYSLCDPLLQKVFSSEEYSEAKRNIKKVVITV